MTRYCHHHPLEPATWHDARHGLSWCKRCVDPDPADARHARPRLGDGELARLDQQGDEPPFWDQLPNALLSPFQPLVMALWAIGALLLSVIALGLPHGFWVAAAASGFVSAPLVGMLMPRTGGRKRVVSTPWQSLREMQEQLLDIALTLSAAALVTALVLLYCPERFLGFVFLMLAVALPGFILTAALGVNAGSPFKACLELVRTVGPAWGLVAIFTLILMAIQSLVVALFWRELPDAWSVPVIVATSLYGLMVLSALLSAAGRQYARSLPGSGNVLAKTSGRPAGEKLHEAVDLWARQGDFFEVERSLWKALKQRPGQMTWQDELIRLLEYRHDGAGKQAWLDQYLREILNSGDKARLMLLYNARLRGSQPMKPSVPELRVELARALRAQGNPEEAMGWLLNLHHEFPAWPGVADAYGLLVQILCEDVGRPELAKPSAQYLLERYPQYRERAKMEALLKGPH